MTQKTNLGLVEHAKKWLGRPYWYGTCCYKCTDALYKRKRIQYPSHYGNSRTSQYMQDIANQKECADCIGLIKGYYWTNDEGKQVYKLDGRPDTSADGMRNKCAIKNDISKMPDVPGMLVFYPGHVGIYIGNGEVIEARGFNYGVVKTKLKDRAWKYYGQCPFIDYVTATAEPQTPTPITRPLLKLNIKNQTEHIKTLQAMLQGANYKVDITGEFDDVTCSAVLQYQKDRKLLIDGIVGNQTWGALIANAPPYRNKTVLIEGVYSETEAGVIVVALQKLGYRVKVEDNK